MTGHHPTKDDLLMDLIKTNRRTEGETITKKQYRENGDYNPWQATTHFDNWTDAKTSAGVYKQQGKPETFSDKEILQDIKKVDDQTEDKILVEDYKEHGQHSISNIYNRFDSFCTAVEKARNI